MFYLLLFQKSLQLNRSFSKKKYFRTYVTYFIFDLMYYLILIYKTQTYVFEQVI